MLKVNLGCGFEIKDGFINVDLDYEKADVLFDLNNDWNFVKRETIDFVLAAHIFEHLNDIIHTMNELYKILKVGGRAEIHVPSTDGRGAWQDPTHKHSFWNINSFRYYSSSYDYGLWTLCKKYGFVGDFKVIELHDYEVPEKIIVTKAILEKV